MNDGHANALPNGHALKEYEIESVLGEGGFAITYLVRQTALEKRFAVKEYLPRDIAARPDGINVGPTSKKGAPDFGYGLDRFLKEARILARFSHPNIVQVQNFFEANGTAYLVMNYEEGESLAEILDRSRTLDEARLNDFLFPLLDGLAEVHKAGVLHRDIKPDNIFIRKDGGPVLLDFGAARHALRARSHNLTSIVTPGFAPHEQYYSTGRQSAATDIYALGATLYLAMTGKKPPDAPARVEDDPLVPAAVAAKDLYGAGTLAAVDQALRVKMEDRPQDVASWRALFEAAPPKDAPKQPLREDPTTVTVLPGEGDAPVPKTRILQRRSRRAPVQRPPRTRGHIAAVLLFVVIGAGAALLLFPAGDPEPGLTVTTQTVDPKSFKESLRPRVMAACMRSSRATPAVCGCRLKILYDLMDGKELEVVTGILEAGPNIAKLTTRLAEENPALRDKLRQAGARFKSDC